MYIISAIETLDPVSPLNQEEFNRVFTRFCTFVSIIYNKKLGYPSIFHYLVKNKELYSLYKQMCVLDTDIEVIKTFISYDQSIYKSKVIKKYIVEFVKDRDRANKAKIKKTKVKTKKSKVKKTKKRIKKHGRKSIRTKRV